MTLARTIDPDEDDDDPADALPDEATHVVVVGDSFGAPAPEGHGADRLVYEAGDKLPFAVGARALPGHPSTLVALDDEGEVVSGAHTDADDDHGADEKSAVETLDGPRGYQ